MIDLETAGAAARLLRTTMAELMEDALADGLASTAGKEWAGDAVTGLGEDLATLGRAVDVLTRRSRLA